MNRQDERELVGRQQYQTTGGKVKDNSLPFLHGGAISSSSS
jgi:hypothetical protein